MAAIQQLLGGKTPQGNALNPALASLAGTAPTNFNQFDYTGALDYTNRLEQAQNDAAKQMAAQLTGAADLGHAESQHGGGFLNTVKNAVTHPGNLVGMASNPASWLSNAKNAIKGEPIDPYRVQ